jgi:hypothetical protein
MELLFLGMLEANVPLGPAVSFLLAVSTTMRKQNSYFIWALKPVAALMVSSTSHTS